MVAYEKAETARGDRGVVHPSVKPVLDTIALTDKTKKFTAGTILRKTATKDTYEAAAAADTLAAGAACVLVQDADGKNPEYQGLFGGVAVSGRLIDASGTDPVAASDALKAKLPALGIHLTQLFVGETK